MKVIFCGGGTSGHVNPALNIAETLKKRMPETEIMFIGTERGIESTLIPKAGYPIEFVEVSGFSRRLTMKNLKAAWHAVTSVYEAKKIIKKFDEPLLRTSFDGNYLSDHSSGSSQLGGCNEFVPEYGYKSSFLQLRRYVSVYLAC
jgi:UDP:flavonoid glycosyltransferase YjiC (YdhE family)